MSLGSTTRIDGQQCQVQSPIPIWVDGGDVDKSSSVFSDDQWGLLICPVARVVDRTVPNDDCSTWPVVNPSERKPSLLLALVGGGSQNQNRYSPPAHEEKDDAARGRGHHRSTGEHGKVAVFSMPESRTKFGRAVTEASGEEKGESAVESDPPFRMPGVATLRAAFLLLDGVDLVAEMQQSASVMKSVPECHRVLAESQCGQPWKRYAGVAEAEREHVRKGLEFVLLQRMLLHRLARGGFLPRSKLGGRFESFVRKDWRSFIMASRTCNTSRDRPSTEKSTRSRLSEAEGSPKPLLLTRRGQVWFFLLVCWFPCVRHGPGVRTEAHSMVRRGWRPFLDRCANRCGLL